MIEETVIKELSSLPSIVSAHLFGSHAEGRAGKESDVDIAVLFSKNKVPNKLDLIQIRERLSEVLNKEVDLVNLNDASPIIGFQVYKNGKTLFVKDEKTYNLYIIALFTDYADLKRIRKPMEDKILERKYYGRPRCDD